MEDNKSFWSTFPGILTGGATFMTALVGLLTFFKGCFFGEPIQHNQPNPPVAIVEKQTKMAHSSKCDRVLGNWSWFIGGVVTVKLDGNLEWRAKSQDVAPTAYGTWVCTDPEESRFIFTWPNGSNDALTLSTDGKTISGTNQAGIAISGKR